MISNIHLFKLYYLAHKYKLSLISNNSQIQARPISKIAAIILIIIFGVGVFPIIVSIVADFHGLR